MGASTPTDRARAQRTVPLAVASVLAALSATLPPAAAAADVHAPGVAAHASARPAIDGVEHRTPDLTDRPSSGDDAGQGTAGSPVARGGEEVAQPFSLLGVRIGDGTADGPVRIRVRTDDAWGQWTELDVDTGHAPDAGLDAATSEPFWVDSADAYEVEVASSDAASTEVVLVRDLGGPVGPVAPLAGGGGHAQPTIRSRASWGAARPLVIPARTTDVRFAVVHHSVSTNSYSSAQVPSILRGIQQYHLSQGWDDIAYNFAVDRFGTTWEARYGSVVAPVVGGHAKGFNLGSVGVVVLGEYGAVAPTSAATNAVGNVAGWKLGRHGVDPRGSTTEISGGSSSIDDGEVVTIPRIVGHRDLSFTSCPGNNLYARLGTIRTVAAARYATTVERHRDQVLGDVDGDGADDALWWAARDTVEQLWRSDGARAFTRVAAPTIDDEPTSLLRGDFDGDGRLDLIAYVEGPGADQRWSGQADGTMAPTALSVGGAYRPSVGDFDGNGVDDVLWYGWKQRPDYLWLSDPGGAVRSRAITVNGGYSRLLGDFDGSGTTDVLWYGAGSDPDALWLMQPDGSHVNVKINVSGTYLPIVGDVDADGDDDVLWYGVGTRADSIWLMNAAGGHTSWPQSINGVYEPIQGDFDGNGTDDIVWYAPGRAQDHRWRYSVGGARHAEKVTINGTYLPAVGDLDGNGIDDISWHGPAGAADTIWFHGAGGSITSSPMVVDGAPTAQ